MIKSKRWLERLFTNLHDSLIVVISWFLAHWIGFSFEPIPDLAFNQACMVIPYVFIIQWLAFICTGVPRSMWRFTSLYDFFRIIRSSILGGAGILLFLYSMSYLSGMPRSVISIFAILITFLLSSSRFSVRTIKDYLANKNTDHGRKKIRVLIVGAGRAGEGMVRDILRSNNHNFVPAVFVDDKISKQGQEIHGVRIVGVCKEIPDIVRDYDVEHLMLAIPSLSSKRLREVLSFCKGTNLPISTLPSLGQLVSGKVSVDLLRDVGIDDLVGRSEISIDWGLIGSVAKDKVILVTGAGGSIGSELCRQVASLGVKRLIAVDNSEFNLFTIEQELTSKFPKLDASFNLKDIRDADAIKQVFKTYQPNIIFHAAAFKHVPLMETQVREAAYNNVVGTYYVAKYAIEFNAERFILVSTDKAVNPSNVMGATKRLAEIICQTYSRQQSNTKFVTVRFGNVIDSAGSVIPTFRQQIEQGGPITVTHPNVTRFFMTITEASQLILQASSIGSGGEIFILDMGEPIKIISLAEQMINLSGKVLGEDIDVEYTGLRPGEKMFEELFHESEELEGTPHNMILKAKSRICDSPEVMSIFYKIKTACEKYNESEILPLIKRLVPEYTG